MLELLTRNWAFLYPPASEPGSELIRRWTTVNRRSQTKLPFLDALLSPCVCRRESPSPPSPKFTSWPTMQNNRVRLPSQCAITKPLTTKTP
jgi:hypothetical protein